MRIFYHLLLLICFILLCIRGEVSLKRDEFSALKSVKETYVHNEHKIPNEEKKFDEYFSQKISASIKSFEKHQKNINNLNIPKGIVFNPENLDFENSPLCIPTPQNIKITNYANQDFKIKSVSTDSLHFHPSITENTLAKANGGMASITVIFLPRSVGKVNAMLVIQSNFGPIVYNIRGSGVPNKYKVKPILGHKLPVDVDYRRPITLHNPHEESLKVKEIYTSEGFLLLSLPDVSKKKHEEGGPGKLWEVPPHQTKTIIFLDFQAKQPGKYQGFIHMQTEKDNLIVHVEFIVSKSGVHSIIDEIDFGTLISPTERRSREVILLNSSPLPVKISDVYALTQDSQLTIEFQKGTLVQGALSTVATISYSGQLEGKFSGKILFRTNDTNPLGSRIEIPYKSRVIHGNLDYKVNTTAFYTGDLKDEGNSIFIVNRFSTPILIKSVDIEDSNFKVLNFESGKIISPKKSETILKIKFTPNTTNLISKSNLILETNITKLYVPLYYFHGKFKYLSYENEIEKFEKEIKLDFGIIGLKEKKIHRFYIKNPNPIALSIESIIIMLDGKESKEITFQIENVVELFNNSMALPSTNFASALTDEDDYSYLSVKLNKKKYDKNQKVILKPGFKALVRISISSSIEKEHEGEILVKSSYDTLSIPFQFVSSTGDLKFDSELNFGKTYPGKTFKQNMFVTNTHKYPVKVNQITSSDDRMIPYLVNELLEPSKEILIGQILFDASSIFFNNGKYSIFKDLQLISKEDLKKFKKRMSPFKEKDSFEVKSKISLHTNLLSKYNFRVLGEIQKPYLSTSKIDFKLVHIGTAMAYYVRVKNPTDFPLEVKLFLGGDNYTTLRTKEDEKQFRLSKRFQTLLPSNTVTDLGPIIFSPTSLNKINTFLYIKNNLTIFEKIPIFGEGGIGHVVFKQDNGKIEDKLIIWKINQSEIGKFENDKFMINSTLKSSKDEFIIFTKKFKIQNLGNLPIIIQSINIDNSGCSSYGVNIKTCNGMTIQPKEEKDFIITFQPDFTTSKLNFLINFESEIGRHSYSAIIELPHSILPYLYDSQPITFTYTLFRSICSLIVFFISIYMIYKVITTMKSLENNGKIELPILTTDLQTKENSIYSSRINLNLKNKSGRISPVRRSPRKITPSTTNLKKDESIDLTSNVVTPEKKKNSKKVQKKKKESPSPIEGSPTISFNENIVESPISKKNSPKNNLEQISIGTTTTTELKDQKVEKKLDLKLNEINSKISKSKLKSDKKSEESSLKNSQTKEEKKNEIKKLNNVTLSTTKKSQQNSNLKKQNSNSSKKQTTTTTTTTEHSIDEVEKTEQPKNKQTYSMGQNNYDNEFTSQIMLNSFETENQSFGSPPPEMLNAGYRNNYEETNVLSRLSQALKPTSNDSYFSLFTDPISSHSYGDSDDDIESNELRRTNSSNSSRFAKKFNSTNQRESNSSSFFSMDFPKVSEDNSLFRYLKDKEDEEENTFFSFDTEYDQKNDETFSRSNQNVNESIFNQNQQNFQQNQFNTSIEDEEEDLPEFFRSN